MNRYTLILFFVMGITMQSGFCTTSAERSLSRDYYFQGEQMFMVRLTIASDEKYVFIQETIPTGWSVSRAPGATIVDNVLTWEKEPTEGSVNIRYYLDAPKIATGDAHFSGTVNEEPIGGDSVLVLPSPTPGKQVPLSGSHYQHWLYLPDDYSSTAEPCPLILFLHCSPVVRIDMNSFLTFYDVAPITILSNSENEDAYPELFQSIVVSPHSTVPRWDKNKLYEFLNELMSEYTIDPNRVYLIGLGIGAADGWDFANRYPESVTAFISIILAVAPSEIDNLASVPFWVFQIELNPTVPPEQMEPMINQVRSLGGTVQSTIYPSDTEDLLGDIFRNPEIYKWLTNQNKHKNISGFDNWNMY